MWFPPTKAGLGGLMDPPDAEQELGVAAAAASSAPLLGAGLSFVNHPQNLPVNTAGGYSEMPSSSTFMQSSTASSADPSGGMFLAARMATRDNNGNSMRSSGRQTALTLDSLDAVAVHRFGTATAPISTRTSASPQHHHHPLAPPPLAPASTSFTTTTFTSSKDNSSNLDRDTTSSSRFNHCQNNYTSFLSGLSPATLQALMQHQILNPSYFSLFNKNPPFLPSHQYPQRISSSSFVGAGATAIDFSSFQKIHLVDSLFPALPGRPQAAAAFPLSEALCQGEIPAPAKLLTNKFNGNNRAVDQGHASGCFLHDHHDAIHRGAALDPQNLVKRSFPEKIYSMLEAVEAQGHDSVISYVADGAAFMIHNPTIFETDIMPLYFSSRRMASFQRQLNIYGFKRVEKGPFRGAYSHECFQKGQKHLLSQIKRIHNNKQTAATAVISMSSPSNNSI